MGKANKVNSCKFQKDVFLLRPTMCNFIKIRHACYDLQIYLRNLLQDPSLLEFAWLELLEGNKSVTAGELAEVCVFECDIWCFIVSPLTFLHSYRWYLALRNLLRATVRISCFQEMKFTSLCLTAKALVLFMVLDQRLRYAIFDWPFVMFLFYMIKPLKRNTKAFARISVGIWIAWPFSLLLYV